MLEHVRDSRRALENLAGALAEGGRMAHFIPCVNTLFASLNRLLGNGVARRLLHGLDPALVVAFTAMFAVAFDFDGDRAQ